MDKKVKTILIGAVIGVLAIVVIYINFFSGGGEGAPSEVVEQAQQGAQETIEQQQAIPPAPEPTNVRSGRGRSN